MESRFEEGQSASAEALMRQLVTAPPSFLEGALENPCLSPGHLLLVLKNAAAAGPLITRIGRNPSWLKSYDVKAAIVLHPRTPRTISMNLVSFLRWHDLARVTDRSILPPPLRRTAERILEVRVLELAVGEKISLARIASRGVINVMRKEADPVVIRALLQNPRLLEGDALAIACGSRTPRTVLRVLAEDNRWSSRPSIRKAIARNPETPPAVALRIVQVLGRADLKDLTRGPKVPALVKVAAQRRLAEMRRPARDGGEGQPPPS